MTPEERTALLNLADAAIRGVLWPDTPMADTPMADTPMADTPMADTPMADPPDGPTLRERHGVFVTVMVDGNLNGCIGSLWGDEPLNQAVPRLARQAAFADPRLPRLTADDYPRLELKISILSKPTTVPAGSEEELLGQLQPGLDGLIIASGRRQATFLPAVWQALPAPSDFLVHLLAKAGMSRSTWPRGMQAWRYRTIEISSRPGNPRDDVS